MAVPLHVLRELYTTLLIWRRFAIDADTASFVLAVLLARGGRQPPVPREEGRSGGTYFAGGF